jgi:hypothetical protein
MLDATYLRLDLTPFARIDELGLEVIGQRLEPEQAVLACRAVSRDELEGWCRRCGAEGAHRATPSPAGWHTSRSAGGRRSCWSRSAATGTPAAGTLVRTGIAAQPLGRSGDKAR